jgi:glycosyltransferase involved in cell wall biosynthesis
VPAGFSFRFLVHDNGDREVTRGISYLGYGSYRELVCRILSLTSVDTDMIYASRPYSISGLVSYFAAKMRGIAYALDVDDRTFPSEINKWWRLPLYCQEWMVERILKSLEPPTSVASQALASYWGAHTTYIPNSADTSLFAPGKGDADYIFKHHALAPPVLLWPAVFFQETDRHYVLEVFSEIKRTGKNVSLLVLGDGEYLPEVRRRATSLGLDNIRFAGRVPHERMIDYYASAQAGVVPLRNNHYDACKGPIKLYEYMAMGLTVIATDIGEPAAMVKRSGCGIVIPFKDAAKAAEMIIDFCSSADRLKLHGMKGRSLLETEHSLDHHAGLLEGLLRRAVRKKQKE